ncbi:MAG: ferrous iron transporter B [Firmicutes bacterium HGW-Firmicutes-13]|nr:MAG: ferrous iron transporter B [Firmicutes bacterium HGW-Firmicutes-13]
MNLLRKRPESDMDYSLLITMERQKAAKEILKGVLHYNRKRVGTFKSKLSTLTMHPWWGFLFLAVVLYYGLYKFVGVFGAGTVVDFIDGYFFGNYMLPFLNTFTRVIPFPWLTELLVSDYGIFNLGLRYGLAIVLPIVTSFFLFFSILEDSGYLPRLAMLLDKLFKKFGLNGRSVIPLILGLGCGTMAVVAARTLETKRERFIATLLLALGIPCSAQLGLIMAMLAREPGALILWGVSLLIIIIGTGCITDKVLPGESPGFYMEIPSLRFPNIQALLSKTTARITWYMKEIIPLFLLVSLIMWAGNRTGLIALINSIMEPVLSVMGLPREIAPVFILGFFRRDYGAAGLYDLLQGGFLSLEQLVVASLILTLFLPCIAQFIMVLKEQGPVKGMAVLLIVLSTAFSAGYILNVLLQNFNILTF